MIVQGWEWEFKKRAEPEIVLTNNTKNGLKTQEKAHFGVYQQQKRS